MSNSSSMISIICIASMTASLSGCEGIDKQNKGSADSAVNPVPTRNFQINDGSKQRSRIERIRFETNDVECDARMLTLSTLADPTSTYEILPKIERVEKTCKWTVDILAAGKVLKDGIYQIARQPKETKLNLADTSEILSTDVMFQLMSDFSGDGRVDVEDYKIQEQSLGARTGDTNFFSYLDVNEDKLINQSDLGKTMASFGASIHRSNESCGTNLTGCNTISIPEILNHPSMTNLIPYCRDVHDCDDFSYEFGFKCQALKLQYPSIECAQLVLKSGDGKEAHALNTICVNGVCCVVEPQGRRPSVIANSCRLGDNPMDIGPTACSSACGGVGYAPPCSCKTFPPNVRIDDDHLTHTPSMCKTSLGSDFELRKCHECCTDEFAKHPSNRSWLDACKAICGRNPDECEAKIPESEKELDECQSRLIFDCDKVFSAQIVEGDYCRRLDALEEQVNQCKEVLDECSNPPVTTTNNSMPPTTMLQSTTTKANFPPTTMIWQTPTTSLFLGTTPSTTETLTTLP